MKQEERGISPAMIITAVAYTAVQLISNICSLQIVNFLGYALDAGTFIYPFAFTLRDISQKILGKTGVKILIFASTALSFTASAVFWLVSKIPVDVNAGGSSAWAMVLTPVWRITVASTLAGVISELVDTEIYSFWTEKVTRKHQWLRVLVSNLFSVPLDSLIFSFGAFFGTMPVASVWEIFAGNIAVKMIVTLISIPMIYTVKDTEEVL